jgi:hypothetical protein
VSSGIGTHNVAKTEAIMSTLTYAGRDLAAASTAEKPKRQPIWRRVFAAISRSQQMRAEREIARYLASHGGLLTDSMEREMLARLSGKRDPL